jgi:hypothetical protein
MMFQVEVFWVMTPCNIVVEFHRFRGPCCLHLQVENGDSMDFDLIQNYKFGNCLYECESLSF